MEAWLALEDGTVFRGKSFGSTGIVTGEVVFNTSMTGYQEILTDPSYCGQILVLTYPLVGNYGINEDDFESDRPWLQGLIIKELCEYPSNWRCRMNLDEFCSRHGIIGLAGIDTRTLTRRLRSCGTMRGVIATGEQDADSLIEKARQAPPISGRNLVKFVSTKEVKVFGNGPFKVVVLDLGVKRNIIRFLVQNNCTVYVVPAWTPAEEILSHRPHGVVLSNGPGDPRDAVEVVETTRQLIGKVPLLGVCLGHQILGLAFGGETYKLKYGHRGANHPVKDLKTGRVYITSQNHGYAVDEESIPAGELVVTHRNLNDGTVEGIRHRTEPIFSYQFHPEGSPGILDTTHLFERFVSCF